MQTLNDLSAKRCRAGTKFPHRTDLEAGPPFDRIPNQENSHAE